MGRPPLNATVQTVKTTVRLEQETVDRIYAIYGPQDMATFVRRAIEERLQREEATAYPPGRRPGDAARTRERD